MGVEGARSVVVGRCGVDDGGGFSVGSPGGGGGGGGGGGSSGGGGFMGIGGQSVSRLAAPQRHLERALVGFPPSTAPLDHARLRLRLARLADAAATAAVRGGGGAAAGVGHWEVATAHLLAAAEAFQLAPPEAVRVSPGPEAAIHTSNDTSAASSSSSAAAAAAAAAAAWGGARRGTEELLLTVLRSLVQSSKGGKRHAAHRELYSMALRSLKQVDTFGACLQELEMAARASHVIR